MTKKEKEFIYNLLNKDYILTAMDYNFAEDREKEFKAEHHISFKTANKIIDKFLKEIKK